MAETFLINGQRWRLRFCRLPKGVYGECDPPDTPNKEIRISNQLTGEVQLDAILHEVEHAYHWDEFDEAYVTRIASEKARLLTRLGYARLD